MTELPEWVLKWKGKNIEVHKRRNNYYAYRVTSVYDPSIKRSRKVTLEYLGKITPDGIIPPKHKRKPSAVLEAGNIQYIAKFTKELEEPLKQVWPDKWESLLSLATLKLSYLDPLKRIEMRHETTISKYLWPNARLSKNAITNLLFSVGTDYGSQCKFFQLLSSRDTYIAIDLTHIFSHSKNISWAEKGYNYLGISNNQLEILLMWALGINRPVFIRLLPGSASSAKNLILGIIESGIKNAVVIADKGFYSKENIEELEKRNIHYILPLRRDLPFLRYLPHEQYKEYFMYRENAQWYVEWEWEGRRIIMYLDKKLAAEEENNFLRHVEEGTRKREDYSKERNRFGTLAIITDLGESPEEIYKMYKRRKEIEEVFDEFKNTLEADEALRQSRESLQGYLFVMLLALHLYTQIQEHLARKNLLKDYSVHDVLWHLSKLYVVELEGEILQTEVPKTTRKLIEKLEVNLLRKI